MAGGWSDIGRKFDLVLGVADPLTQRIAQGTQVVSAAADLTAAFQDAKAKRRTMSVLDKLNEVAARRAALNRSLDDGAQKLLDRYAEVDTKAVNTFGRHDDRLREEVRALDELDATVAALSNSLGNLDGSSDGGGNG